MRLFIFLVALLSLGATAMFGLVVGYTLEGKTADGLVSRTVLDKVGTLGEIKKGPMFGITCGCAGMTVACQ